MFEEITSKGMRVCALKNGFQAIFVGSGGCCRKITAMLWSSPTDIPRNMRFFLLGRTTTAQQISGVFYQKYFQIYFQINDLS